MSRVLVDTNVVIWALLVPSSTPTEVLTLVLAEHRLVLTQWVLDELREVVSRTRPDLLFAREDLLDGLGNELASRVIRACRSPILTTSRSWTRPSQPLSTSS